MKYKNNNLCATFILALFFGCVTIGLNTFSFNVLYIGGKLGIKNPVWVIKAEFLTGYFCWMPGKVMVFISLLCFLVSGICWVMMCNFNKIK